MTKEDLLEKVQELMKSKGLEYDVDASECVIRFDYMGGNAQVHCKVLFDDDPLVVHVMTSVGVRVPEEQVQRVIVGLNELNSSLTFGAHTVNADERLVVFRVAFPFEGVVDPGEVICMALGVGLQTMDDQVAHLMKLVFGEAEQDDITKLEVPPRGTSPLQAPDGQRPGFN